VDKTSLFRISPPSLYVNSRGVGNCPRSEFVPFPPLPPRLKSLFSNLNLRGSWARLLLHGCWSVYHPNISSASCLWTCCLLEEVATSTFQHRVKESAVFQVLGSPLLRIIQLLFDYVMSRSLDSIVSRSYFFGGLRFGCQGCSIQGINELSPLFSSSFFPLRISTMWTFVLPAFAHRESDKNWAFFFKFAASST